MFGPSVQPITSIILTSIHEPRFAESTHARGGRVPERPGIAGVLRARRPRETPRLSRPGVLGPSRAVFWKRGREADDRGPRARRAWGESHRPDVYRRSLRRVPVPRPTRDRIRDATDQYFAR